MIVTNLLQRRFAKRRDPSQRKTVGLSAAARTGVKTSGLKKTQCLTG
jgi:hypothetical protein